MTDAHADELAVPAPRVVAALERASLIGGIATAAIGVVVLAGWAFDVALLRRIHPSFASMKVNAAIAFVMAGTALALRYGGDVRRNVSRALSGGVSLIGALTLIEYLDVDLGIDELLFSDEEISFAPGRMSPTTAINFVLIGLALALFDTRVRADHYPAEWLALAAGALAMVALLGNLYGVRALYAVGAYEAVALHPAVALVVCCASILFARPARGLMRVVSSEGPAGTLTRRLLPAALLFPAVLGGMLYAGESLAFYDVEHETALFAAGSIVGFTAIVWWTASALSRVDVARRAAEVAVREREEDLSTTLDSIGDGVIATDEHGQVTRMNPVAERLTGWTVDEARERHLDDVFRIVSEDTGATVESPVARVLRDGQVVGLANHTALIARGGDVRAIADSGAPIRDGGHLRGVVLVFRDITDERRAEEALRHSQARFARLAESGVVGIVIASADGALVEVNDAFASLVDRPRDSLVGARWLEMFAPESRPAAEAAWAELHARGVAPPTEHECLRGDGGRAPVLVGIAALGDETIAFVADLRERRERERAEQALHRTEAQLRQSQKMEAVGRLAGGIAHDFNNLLTVIISYGTMLVRRLPPTDPRAVDIGEMVRAANRAADLTRQLLAFSRRQVLLPSVVDLAQVAEGMSKMLRRVIGEDVELEIVAAAPVDLVHVDPGQIEQVILNLVVNARDAMPQGGRITIETANVDLDEAFCATHLGVTPGRYVRMIVRDTGVGIDAETSAHIFEPFFTTKEAGKGTGLGLSTVMGIVEQSGGTIWVDSKPGRGAAFEIYLPRHAMPSVGERAVAITGAPDRGSETILLVEDDGQVRNLVRTILRGHGYAVLEATNAGDALLICEQHEDEIDLLLTDVVMPRMSGRQLAERLALLRPRMRVLFMSGYTDDEVVRHGVERSALAFIQKPLTPEALLGKVREVLDQPPPP